MKRSIFRIRDNIVKHTLMFITISVTIGVSFTLPLPANAGEGIIVAGVVTTSILDNGDMVSVKLDLRLGKDEFFNIVLNENGKKLGKEMNGSWVEVIGTIYHENDQNWLEVRSYEKADYFE